MNIRLSKFKKTLQQRYLYLIPCFFTFLNAICGFLAILKAFEGNCKAAALYIMIAAVCDAFDGRLARVIGSSSYFGMELDSLCDAISFCLAPTVVLYSWLPLENFLGKVVLASYLCAGLTRLAQYNSSMQRVGKAFKGLPTTFAALFIASLIFYQQWFIAHGWDFVEHKIIVSLLIIAVAYLMISPVRFTALKEYKFMVARDIPIAFLSIFIGLWLIAHKMPLLLLLTFAYIVYHVLAYILGRRIQFKSIF